MLTVFTSYIAFIWIKYGVQRSISDSYYRLPKSLQPLFTFFCWGFGLPAIIVGTTLTDAPWMFLAGAGICFVGVAAEFKKKLTKTVHMAGAYGGVALSQLAICINFKMWYLTVGFVIIAGILQIINHYNKKFKTCVWWQEILAFITIIIVFTVNLFPNVLEFIKNIFI